MEWRGGETIGIAVGNACARAAVYEGGRARLVPVEEGETVMPSAVLLHRLREVGKYACLYSGTDPQLLAAGINRLIGREYQELGGELGLFSCELRSEGRRARVVDWRGEGYSPADLYAMVLRKLRQAAERYLGHAVERAVIAVPGSFNDYQRRGARVAAESVFAAVKLINEPTAAAIALGRGSIREGERLMTFDLGAGKCEVAIIARRQGRLSIEAIAGDTRLGGDDIDRLLLDHLADQFFRAEQQSMFGDSAMARHEALMAVRAAKHLLALENSAQVSVPFVNFDRLGRPLHLHAEITRELAAQLCAELMARAGALIRRCKADVSRLLVDRVMLMGGSTRLPFVSEMVSERAGINTIVDGEEHFAPEELAVLGAARYGASLAGSAEALEVEEITAHSLGIRTYSGDMGVVLKRQSKVPAATTKRFYTVEDNQRTALIEVREGEEQQAQENRMIGEFSLPLPPRLPAHSPIDVTIGKDEDGIVTVEARDSEGSTSREISITYDL